MTRTTIVFENGATHKALRQIRLYHWLQCLKHREKANKSRYTRNAEYHHQIANRHLGNVQTLNEFFPIDDTAERDASKTVL